MKIVLILILVIGVACGFGAITKRINEDKGYDGGFAWGFFLGVMGIVVVACRPFEPSVYGRLYMHLQEKMKRQE